MTIIERPIHHTCPDCGYELAGVPTVGCPECGVHTRDAGRKRNMHRHAPLFVVGFGVAAVFAPLAALIDPMLWLVFGPVLALDLVALVWILRRPASLFWLDFPARLALHFFAWIQLVVTIPLGCRSIAALVALLF